MFLLRSLQVVCLTASLHHSLHHRYRNESPSGSGLRILLPGLGQDEDTRRIQKTKRRQRSNSSNSTCTCPAAQLPNLRPPPSQVVIITTKLWQCSANAPCPICERDMNGYDYMLDMLICNGWLWQMSMVNTTHRIRLAWMSITFSVLDM